MTVDSSKIIVYQSADKISIDVILEIPPTNTGAWNASVDVFFAWGASVTCSTNIYTFSQKFATINCPSVALDGAPACNSTFTLGMRWSTATYADVTGAKILCDGKTGPLVEFQVPLTCPTCPTLSSSANYQPCQFPKATCNYPAYTSSGGVAQLPCNCYLNNFYGDRRWSCAVP